MTPALPDTTTASQSASTAAMADVPASKATQTTNGTASAAADSAPAATTTMTNAPAKNNPSSMLPYMHLLEALKTTKRTGWINESIPLPESIADHMYRMAMITLMCTDASLDRSKLVKIALVHDLAEAIVGDITPMDRIPKAEKARRELAAMETICSQLVPRSHAPRGEEIMALFREYEDKATPEARYVKDVDKYELVLQTFEYERRHEGAKKLDSFVAVQELVQHPEVRAWVDEALAERDAWWAAKEAEDGGAAAGTLGESKTAQLVNDVLQSQTVRLN